MTAASPAPTFGVDLGGTNLRVGVVDADGELREQHRVATPQRAERIVDAIADAVDALAGRHPGAGAVGIGAAGMVDRDGAVHYAPNIPVLIGVGLRARVAAATGRAAVADNDANVAALAEYTYGAARGCANFLLVTLGTGIGGGVVVEGTVLRGAHGFGAEIGHFQVDPQGPVCVCGGRGHWEATASGPAFGAIARQWAGEGRAPAVLERAGGDVAAVTGEHVGDAARAGDAAAVRIVREYAQRVAVGLVGLANIFDPAKIVVSGGLVALGDLLLTPVQEWFDGNIEGARYRPPVPIVPAALGERAGVVGAAVLARGLAGA